MSFVIEILHDDENDNVKKEFTYKSDWLNASATIESFDQDKERLIIKLRQNGHGDSGTIRIVDTDNISELFTFFYNLGIKLKWEPPKNQTSV
jgi:hypothetical protein